jgi:hypothetical protein
MRPRPGFALLVTLLMTLALAAIGAGMLTVAAREAEVAAALARGVPRAAQPPRPRSGPPWPAWSTRSVAHLGPGETAALALGPGSSGSDSVAGSDSDSGEAAVHVTRVHGDLFLVDAVAHGTARAAVAVRTLDPGLLTRGLPGGRAGRLRGPAARGHGLRLRRVRPGGRRAGRRVAAAHAWTLSAVALGEPGAEAAGAARRWPPRTSSPCPSWDALADVSVNGRVRVAPARSLGRGQCCVPGSPQLG